MIKQFLKPSLKPCCCCHSTALEPSMEVFPAHPQKPRCYALFSTSQNHQPTETCKSENIVGFFICTILGQHQSVACLQQRLDTINNNDHSTNQQGPCLKQIPNRFTNYSVTLAIPERIPPKLWPTIYTKFVQFKEHSFTIVIYDLNH